MPENYILVQKGFRILQTLLANYVASEMYNEYKDNWWQRVLSLLEENTRKDLPENGSRSELINSLDMANCLRILDREWRSVFSKKLSYDCHTWAKELMGIRNRTAHITGKDFNPDDTWRALDTMSRLCGQVNSEGAEKIHALLREARYGSSEASTSTVDLPSQPNQSAKKKDGVLASSPAGLMSWRNIIKPHPDVAEGRYKKAEFAANLSEVAHSEGPLEYRDPVEFFARTYITDGMKGLLVQALKRVCSKAAEPIIQLKTAFGGGKTHSMIALYHIMSGKMSDDKISSLKPILEQAGLKALPRVNTAVIVGTYLNPAKTRRPKRFPGITINTMWGEIAAQLAEGAGKQSLYDYVKDADKKGVSPGAEALKNLFNEAGPCLVLVDELVAYARKIEGRNDLPAGTLDNFITFIQEITEAACASKNALIVASIPESDIEIGGDTGRKILETVEHTFGRVTSIWKPVAANEGFEVVRRRLFLNCAKPEERVNVCKYFSEMYNTNRSDFPVESREADYLQRMIDCYPIHPEVFDRLYKDWSTLEKFQRTRGVLRLMAAVIHELWMSDDASAMIMPGTIPFYAPAVRDELNRYLPETWNAIVDSEVDGKNSIPYKKDQENTRFGDCLAARRAARTIMLGSAPTSRSQNIRGIDASRIRLGVIQPTENIAVFNDAVQALQNSLSYLYSSGSRYWYDVRPTLRKLAEERAAMQVSAESIELEIEARLRKIRKEAPFAGVHVCPGAPLDVPDEQAVRLVILRPEDDFKEGVECRGIKAADNILNNHSGSMRKYRNMLAFIAPDRDFLTVLKKETGHYLAWKSIKEDSEELNLDAKQNRETAENIERYDKTVEQRIKDTYCHLIMPYINRKADKTKIEYQTARISGGTDSIVSKAAKRMLLDEAIISKWSPAPLLIELDSLFWGSSSDIEVKQLWNALCSYCYLPRLASYSVLENAIIEGVNSNEYFAAASGKNNEGYIGLKLNKKIDSLETSAYIVKVEAAKKQLEQAAASQCSKCSVVNDASETAYASLGSGQTAKDTERKKPTGFYMSAQLDNTRINRDVQKIVEEIINRLSVEDNCEVTVTLEVKAEAANGFDSSAVRTVSENCRTLRIDDFGFINNQ